MTKQIRKTGRYEAEKARLRKIIAGEGRNQTWNWLWAILNMFGGGQPDYHATEITRLKVQQARTRLAEILRLEREQR